MSLPIIAAFLILCAFGRPAQAQATNTPPGGPSPATPATLFDARRNAAADLQAAITEAQRTAKRILLDVGGDWCMYCVQMDELFASHPDLATLRDQHYITVPVYYSDDHKSAELLSRYSPILGIPHFFVLDAKGHLLHSQHVVELREGGKYSADRMRAFLLRWSAPDAVLNPPSQSGR